MADGNQDYRLLPDYPDHWKTVMMLRLCGADAVRMHLRLMGWVRIHSPLGVLGNDTTKIAAIAHFEGDSGEYAAKMVECGYFDLTDGVYSLHQWIHHNPFAANQVARSEAARKASNARWNGGRCGAHPKRIRNASGSDAVSGKRNPPSPSPSPSPSPNKEDSQHKVAVAFWMEAYQNRVGIPYVFQKGKDGAAVKRLLGEKSIGLEGFKKATKLLLNSTDPFWMKNRNLAYLASQINPILASGESSVTASLAQYKEV
jgi:hypothetical protein